MSISISQPGNYSFKKGDILFCEDSTLKSINILLKGKIDVYISPFNETPSLNDEKPDKNNLNNLTDSFKIFNIDQNIFIGTIDQFLKKTYSFTYVASEDTYFYAYPILNENSFNEILESQKDYASHTITSISMMMDKSYEALKEIESWMRKMGIIINNLNIYFWLFKDKYNLTYMPSLSSLADFQDQYQQLKNTSLIPLDYAKPYLDQELIINASLNYTPLEKEVMDKLEYYKRIINLPLQIKKDFFSADQFIANIHFNEAAGNFEKIKYQLKKVLEKCVNYYNIIYAHQTHCLYSEFIHLIDEAKKYNQDTDELFKVLDDLTNKIIQISDSFYNLFNNDLNLDKKQLLINNQLIKYSSNDSKNSSNSLSLHDIPEELVDSAEKIIRYSGIPNDHADLFRNSLKIFRRLDSKLTTDKEVRGLVDDILPIFFDIYKNVFLKATEENNQSPLINMFLNLGYMDENLLSTEEVLTLYMLSVQSTVKNPCHVYSMREWLTDIYLMDKDPSINEFDQDYFDVFRELKKKQKITRHDEDKYNQDAEGRLTFEINNMFKTTHKLAYGQPNTYFPILHSGMINRNLDKAFVTKDLINETIQNILSIDFSIFHREILYQNKTTGIEKELISISVAPDIILLPIFGSRAIMWQVITGRARSTPGRIIIPIFTCENIEDMLIQVIGHFRWELCKTMMGMSWNDITDKSLTSEYMDYIQFYKKNKDLSDEAKSKIRSQILRYNNKVREIFTSDYETWIKYESKGSIRHNKVVRNILFKYCPFEKSIREKLENQPIFNELAIPFNASRNKQAKDLENRYNRLLDRDIKKDKALYNNLLFYKEM